jgi:hypothetical protein
MGLGPLDENEATLGDSTPFPTTVTVGETFTTGLLGCHMKKSMNLLGVAERKEKLVQTARPLSSHLAVSKYDLILSAISKSTSTQGIMPSQLAVYSRRLVVYCAKMRPLAPAVTVWLMAYGSATVGGQDFASAGP